MKTLNPRLRRPDGRGVYASPGIRRGAAASLDTCSPPACRAGATAIRHAPAAARTPHRSTLNPGTWLTGRVPFFRGHAPLFQQSRTFL
ncbi:MULTISPECIES: hypothetical protein [Massilia]|uniref:Uncharacterized protein n=1 Tax=Massilia haematophila TaxID=457923 RepID=A0ABV7PPJ8_9BURK|nr:hypothetical protein [Massilia sp.]